MPTLLDEVQYLHDTYPGRFRFLMTGSSAGKLKTSSANLLPGMARFFHLCPLILPGGKDAPECRVFPVQREPFMEGFPKHGYLSIDEAMHYRLSSIICQLTKKTVALDKYLLFFLTGEYLWMGN